MASEKTQSPEQGTATSAAVKVDGDMSVADFLTWKPPDDLRYQLIDGVPVAMALAGPTHATVRSRLANLLTTHLDAAGSPYIALTGAGVSLTASTSANVRIPDLLVTCSPPADVEESLIADPVLMIEILSPDNAVETWTSVWAYTTLASVQEILVLQTDAIAAHLLRRNEDGSWPPAPVPLGKDLELQSIGFAAPLLSAYRNTWLATAGRSMTSDALRDRGSVSSGP